MGNQPSETSKNAFYSYDNKDRSPTSDQDESKYDDSLTNPVGAPTSTRTSTISLRTASTTTASATSSLSKISNEMMHINRMRHTKRKSIHNGIIGIYLSMESVKVGFNFWTENITSLNMKAQLEIGCSIFFSMVATDNGIKKIFCGYQSPNKLETVSLKFLDMMGYLVRSLLRNDINLYWSLKLLGELHSKAGVSFKMHQKMITAVHETFSYYFADEYTQQVKCAMDDIFGVVSRIMTNQDVLSDINVDYLKSVDKCLMSLDGKTALLSYLKQSGCNNIALFYELLNKFESEANNTQRFLIARDIVRFNIDGIHGKAKKIDISKKTAQKILVKMQKWDELWFKNEQFVMDNALFDEVQHEVNELILKRHWNAFKESILSAYY